MLRILQHMKAWICAESQPRSFSSNVFRWIFSFNSQKSLNLSTWSDVAGQGFECRKCHIPVVGCWVLKPSSMSRCSKYGLDDNTIDFVGHSLALHRDDRFLAEPALDTVQRVKVHYSSRTTARVLSMLSLNACSRIASSIMKMCFMTFLYQCSVVCGLDGPISRSSPYIYPLYGLGELPQVCFFILLEVIPKFLASVV